jgi:excisionase family DNA binding protein
MTMNVERCWLARAFDPDSDIAPWLREHAGGVPIISVGPDKAAVSADLSRMTIYKAIKKGELPAYKCGRRTDRFAGSRSLCAVTAATKDGNGGHAIKQRPPQVTSLQTGAS